MNVGSEMAATEADAVPVNRICLKSGMSVSEDACRRRPLLAPWQINLAKSHMQDRLASAVAISDVASSCRLSVSYFERAFANSVGIAPYAWLLEQRLARAKKMLHDASMPIAQIALDCGFNDQAHFTNMFSRKVGITPRAWRNRSSWTRLLDQ